MIEGIFIAGVLLYGFILAHFIPEKFHVPSNIVAAVVAVATGLLTGLSIDEMGMGLHVFAKGIVVAIVISLLIMVGVFIVASIPVLKRHFVHTHAGSPSRVAYETAVRIPLSTALTEEIIFRGVLLGMLLATSSTIVAVVVGSAIFGLWHIMPSLERIRLHADKEHITLASKTSYVVGTIATTALAGVFFSWLRILSGSIIAPWLTHWSINASAMLASAFIARGQKIKEV